MQLSELVEFFSPKNLDILRTISVVANLSRVTRVFFNESNLQTLGNPEMRGLFMFRDISYRVMSDQHGVPWRVSCHVIKQSSDFIPP
jgi:hypothetical protein